MANDVTFNRVGAETRERWKLVRDVCSESEELKNYLPTLNAADTTDENKARNKAYKERAVFYGATGFTLLGMLGLAFRKDPVLDSAVFVDRLEQIPASIDGGTISIFQQSQQTLSNVLQAGRHGLLADLMPGSDMAAIKSYNAEDILNWRVDLGGRLSMLVLRDSYEREEDYAVELKDRYLEYRLIDGRCVIRVWEKNSDGEFVVTEERTMSRRGGYVDFIPFVFVGSQQNSPGIDAMPLYRLASLNAAHYRNSADYEDSVFFVGQAQPYLSGLDSEWRDWLSGKDEKGKARMYWGSRAPILLPQGGGAGMIQPSPNTLVREAMDQKEAHMVALGARLIQSNLAARTATQSASEREASTSILAICCANVSEAYQTAIRYCGALVDKSIGAEQETFKINQEFVEHNADPATLAQLVSAWQSGVLAKTDVRAWLRLHGVIGSERTDEIIQADVENEGPALGTAGNANGQ